MSAAPPTAVAPASEARLTGLDGLRGIAAVVVLVHHTLLATAAFANAYRFRESDIGWVDAMVKTPLHVTWAATEAVYIFFMISGYALAIAARGASERWGGFVVSRMVRLYGPVFATVAFTAVLMAVTPQGSGPNGSFWIASAAREYRVSDILQDLMLVTGESGVITPLWSLRYEILFSLLLPLYLLVARKVRPAWSLAVALLALLAGHMNGLPALAYAPMFLIGVVFARIDEPMRAWVGRVSEKLGVRIAGTVLVIAAVAAIPAQWYLPVEYPKGAYSMLGFVVTAAACAALVAAAASFPPLVRLLSWRPVAWLGAISFSLYLVHEPIVKAFAFVFPASNLALMAAVVVAFLVATAFHRWVERPIHRFARRLRDVRVEP